MSSESAKPRIDLRSDTVTQPTSRMRKAMAAAEVGDDVLGDDPTVQQLESRVASLFGFESALFVPSGTMGNLMCCLVHCEVRGSELIVGSEAHIHVYEQGGIAQLGGVHSRVVTNQPDGTLPLPAIEALIRGRDDHFPITRLICLETTQNRCGGRILSADYIQSAVALATKHGLKVHIDGARIFNAIQALGIAPSEYVRGVDSISICLSKGLAAPVGSVIVGTKEFIAKARRLRKALGGGMRQVGVLAACGLVALDDMVGRLAEDHQNARALAEGLSKLPGLSVDLSAVETNIVFVDLVAPAAPGVTPTALVAAIKEEGVLAIATGPARFRLVTHYQVESSAVPFVIDTIAKHLHRLTAECNQA